TTLARPAGVESRPRWNLFRSRPSLRKANSARQLEESPRNSYERSRGPLTRHRIFDRDSAKRASAPNALSHLGSAECPRGSSPSLGRRKSPAKARRQERPP